MRQLRFRHVHGATVFSEALLFVQNSFSTRLIRGPRDRSHTQCVYELQWSIDFDAIDGADVRTCASEVLEDGGKELADGVSRVFFHWGDPPFPPIDPEGSSVELAGKADRRV